MKTSDNTEIIKSPENYFDFDFDLVKTYLETLNDNKERKMYLVNARADYRQTHSNTKDELLISVGIDEAVDFGEKCDYEIEILNELILEESRSKKEGVKHKDLNEWTATLFISYLLDFAYKKTLEIQGKQNNKSLSFAAKNRIVNFLTPYSLDQLKKLPAVFNKEKEYAEDEKVGASKKYYDDMKTVRKHFERLGLSEITDKIDADLGE